MRSDGILLAHALLRFQQGDFVATGASLDPSPIFRSALRQDLWGDRILIVYVAEEMHDVLGPGQQRRYPWMTVRSKQ
jgi:hypothetical protein